MSFSGRAQLPANILNDGAKSNGKQSAVNSVLADLRSDVDRLRLENKELAKQLHIDRYVSKNRAHRMINDLRTDNVRLLRENSAAKERVVALTRQAEVAEAAVHAKQKETEQIKMIIDNVTSNNKEMKAAINQTKNENESEEEEIRKAKLSIDDLMSKIRETTSIKDEESQLVDELETAIEKSTIDIEKLQHRHDTKIKESRMCQHVIEQLSKQHDKVEDDVETLSDKLKQIEKEISNLEEKKQKTEEECGLVKQRIEADSAKQSVIFHVLQDQPKLSKEVQTDSFVEGKWSTSADGQEKAGYERGSIVRVMGVGGNTKRKFGKDLEVRATSYSRHVNLNVKLNK